MVGQNQSEALFEKAELYQLLVAAEEGWDRHETDSFYCSPYAAHRHFYGCVSIRYDQHKLITAEVH